MTYDQKQAVTDDDHHSPVDLKTLWSGGAATALVAALIGLVGRLVVAGIFDLSIVRPGITGLFPGTDSLDMMLHGAFLALSATALINVLLLGTPRAHSFFGWIMALVTVVITVAPLAYDEVEWASRIASSAIYLITGIAVTTLIAAVARSAVKAAAKKAAAERAAAQRAAAQEAANAAAAQQAVALQAAADRAAAERAAAQEAADRAATERIAAETAARAASTGSPSMASGSTGGTGPGGATMPSDTTAGAASPAPNPTATQPPPNAPEIRPDLG